MRMTICALSASTGLFLIAIAGIAYQNQTVRPAADAAMPALTTCAALTQNGKEAHWVSPHTNFCSIGNATGDVGEEILHSPNVHQNWMSL